MARIPPQAERTNLKSPVGLVVTGFFSVSGESISCWNRWTLTFGPQFETIIPKHNDPAPGCPERITITDTIIMTKNSYIPEPTDPKEVMAALAYAEKVRQAQEELDRMLIEGLESGPPIEMENLDWAKLDRIIQTAAGKAGKR